jgi:Alpha-L-arabinofuranosidase B (ABFB) domain/Ricin-type beta-trefoil lectin domain-like
VVLGFGAAACSFHSLDYLSEERGSSAGVAGTSHGGTGEAGQGGSRGGSAPTTTGGAGGATSGGGGNTSGAGSSSAGASAGSLGSAGEAPVPDCHDGLATVDETAVDCGGRTCSPCDDGSRCVTGTDCQSAICTNQVCQPPTCTDLALNGAETDLNCGGTCGPCALGHRCKADSDCDHAQCVDSMCRSVSCTENPQGSDCPILIDNTPYQLAPSKAPTRCLDDNGLSVADGNAMAIWSCRLELQQTFWAVDRGDGYFALRSALSGKCLQVRGESSAEGAIVEQFACTYGPAQRWKPSRQASGLLRLTNALSGLALGVAGPNYDEDARAVVQGAVAGDADTSWTITKRESAAYVQFAVHADKTLHAAHEDASVSLDTSEGETTHWRVIPGLADAHAVSFQSRDSPGRYLRHASFRLWSDTNDGSLIFLKDATFKYGAPLVGTHAFTRSLESTNYPGRFFTRRENGISLLPFSNDSTYREDATWWILGP